MNSNRLALIAPLCATLLSLSGCFGSSPPSHFFLLEPLDEGATHSVMAGSKTLVALAPIKIPEYIDRPQIVTAASKNSYALSEFERWAEPLNDNIRRVLLQDVSILTPAEVVPANNSMRAKQAQLRLSVNILEFHVDAQQQARLTAQWYLLNGENMLDGKQSVYRKTASGQDFGTKVAALNDCLHDLSRDIAAALQRAIAQHKAN